MLLVRNPVADPGFSQPAPTRQVERVTDAFRKPIGHLVGFHPQYSCDSRGLPDL